MNYFTYAVSNGWSRNLETSTGAPINVWLTNKVRQSKKSYKHKLRKK